MTTADHPTVPESQATLELQIQQLKDGVRNVVMFPKGTNPPGKARDIGMRDITTGGNRFWYAPGKISKSDIAAAAKKNELPKILGGPDGYGAPDKQDLKQPVEAVVAESPEGIPAQDVATDQEHLPETVAAAEEVTPPGGQVKVESPETVIAKRQNDANLERKNILKAITQRAAAGDIHGALQLASQHAGSGKITDDQVEKALKLAGPAALKAGFAAVKELHDAMQIFDDAQPHERAVFAPILAKRFEEMDAAPKHIQEQALAAMRKKGLIPQGAS